jgi:hypothetical protein
MTVNGALAAAPAGLSARLVAGARRGAPKARHAGGPRASPRVPSRRSAADALAASLGRRSPAPRLAAVREPAGDARRADVASTSFETEDNRRDEPGGASADAARRVRAAKSAVSRYGAGSDAEADEKRHGLASDDDENGRFRRAWIGRHRRFRSRRRERRRRSGRERVETRDERVDFVVANQDAKAEEDRLPPPHARADQVQPPFSEPAR